MTAPVKKTHTAWKAETTAPAAGSVCIATDRLYTGSAELFVGNGVTMYPDLPKTLIDDNKMDAFVTAPASASATGTKGQIAFDDSYIYVCTAANTWKRAAIATWS